MSRVDTKSNVQVGGELTFIENAASRGIIPPFKWEIGETHEAMILKTTTDGRGGYIQGRLPSWVFAEEYLGLTPTIVELGETDNDFIYNVEATAEANILAVVEAKGIQILANSKLMKPDLFPELAMLIADANKARSAKDAFEKEKATAEREGRLVEMSEEVVALINSVDERLKEKVEFTDDMKEKLEKDIERARKAFIRERTQMRIAQATVISTKLNGDFRQGSIPPEDVDEEPTKVARKLASLSMAMARVAFEEQTGLTNKDTDDYKNKWSRYRFDNAPMSFPSVKSALFAVTGNLIYNDETGFSYIKDPKTKQDTELNYIEANSNDKFGKFHAARLRPLADTELDYLATALEFLNGDDKMTVGKNMAVVSHSQRIDPKNIFKTFSPALPEESYRKCYTFMDYDIKECASSMSQWIANNKELIERLPGEEADKLQDAIKEFGIGGMTEDAVDDVISGIMGNQQAGAVEQPQAGTTVQQPETVQPNVVTGQVEGTTTVQSPETLPEGVVPVGADMSLN